MPGRDQNALAASGGRQRYRPSSLWQISDGKTRGCLPLLPAEDRPFLSRDSYDNLLSNKSQIPVSAAARRRISNHVQSRFEK